MKIFVGQIYTGVNANYPFSSYFQSWLSQALTARVYPSETFIARFDVKYDLIIRINAKSYIDVFEIKGPTIFKRDKQIEYVVILPYESINASEAYYLRYPLKSLFEGIIVVLKNLELDVDLVLNDSSALMAEACADPAMIFKD